MSHTLDYLQTELRKLRDKLRGRPTKESYAKLREENKELRSELKAVKAELAFMLRERENHFQQTRLSSFPFTSTRNAKSRS